MKIRIASIGDAEAILAVYAPYVRNTAITFEYDVPEIRNFRSRIKETLKNYPYLVAEENGKIVGYAYAGVLRERAAYQHIAEMSVYVDQECRRRGIGRALYQELERGLHRQNVFSVYACVTASGRKDDAYVDDGSIRFHERMGYGKVGEYPLCGYKFGRWYDVVWLVKDLGEKPDQPEPFIPFSALYGQERDLL